MFNNKDKNGFINGIIAPNIFKNSPMLPVMTSPFIGFTLLNSCIATAIEVNALPAPHIKASIPAKTAAPAAKAIATYPLEAIVPNIKTTAVVAPIAIPIIFNESITLS